MNTPYFNVDRRADMDEMIALAASTSHIGHVTLLRAARDGVINVVMMDRLATPPMKTLEQSRRPTIVVLGDDDYQSTGPCGWPGWRRLKYWPPRMGLIHATGADAKSYQLAITIALVQLRLVLIETDTDHAQAWADALFKSRIRAIGLLPPDGPHPVMPDKGEMQ